MEKVKSSRKNLKIVVCFVELFLVGVGIFGSYRANKVGALEKTLSTRADFETGKFDGVVYDRGESGLRLKSAGGWVPKTISTPHLPLNIGTAIVSDGEYVYVLVGRDNYFMRYKPKDNKWQVLATPIKMPDYGASMTVLGDYIYVVWGGYQRDFSRYSIKNNSWSEMPNLPALTHGGSSIGTDGTDLFILRGYNSTDFWKFDINQNNWVLVASTPATINYGADLVYDDGYLYTPRGNNTATFYRYDIANNTWTSRENVPATLNDVHNIEVADGYIYVLRDISSVNFYRYKISSDTWETITSAPATTRYVGVVFNQSDNMLYVVRGNNTQDVWKFDIGTTSFLGPSWAPNTFGSGADLIHNGGSIYATRGNTSNTFYKYTIATDLWSTLANAPNTLADDTSSALAGNNIYFFRGSSTNTFWIYNIASNSWSVGVTAPATVSHGGNLVYPGSGDFLYATRGMYTRTFWRYSIGSSVWQIMDNLPENAASSYGARLVADGQDSNKIYYLSGSRTGDIYMYEISENRWTDIGNLPYAPFWGTDAVYWNKKIFVQSGYYKTDFWEFDLEAGDSQYSWRKLDDLSNFYGYQRGPYNGGNLAVDNNGNIYSTFGQSLAYMQMYVTSNNKYLSSGNWISEVIDLNYVKVGSSMTVSLNGSIPIGAGVTVQTKTSGDNVNWGSWQDTVGQVVMSETNKYLQVRLILNGNNSQSPIVNSVEVGYQGDVEAPTNPSFVSGYSRQILGSELESGQTYNYLSPYFVWSGATDVDTGIEGYYVYFGDRETADPQVDGDFQTSSSYVVTEGMRNGTYYLRIKTRDMAGNVSQVWEAFEYTYQGLEHQSLSVGASSFLGETNSVVVDGSQIKLKHRDGFWSDGVLANTPASIYYGGDLAYSEVDNKLFLLRGRATNNFYIYNMNLGIWSTGAATPTTVTYGGVLTEGPPGYLYALQGNNTTGFWKYDILANSWSVISSTPAPVFNGASLVSDKSRYVYVMKGNDGDAFWKYDTVNDQWFGLATTDFGAPGNQVNNLVSYGGDLAWDGHDTIYAIQGNLRSGFAAYTISLNEWNVLPNLPALAYAGAEIEYDRGTNAIYFTPANVQESFFKYDVEDRTWSSLGNIPTTVYDGCSMKNVSGKIYMTRGYDSTLIYTYDVSANTWSVPNRNLFNKSFRGVNTYSFNSGSSISKGEHGDYFIAMGNDGNTFLKWNENTGEVIELADMPTGVREGGDTVYVSGSPAKVFAVASSYNRKFYEYNVATDKWTEIVNDPLPVDPGTTGSSLTYDGNRYIYWARGNSNAFYRYDTQAVAGSRWVQMQNINGALGWGGEILHKDGYVYALRGAGQNSFYRFNVGTTAWQGALANVPAVVNYGGFIANGDSDSIYACLGTNTGSCYKYKISTNSWQSISNFPTAISYGGAGVGNGLNKIYVIAGTGTNSFNDGLYTYVMSTNDSAYVESGSYVSQSHDLSQAYRFANLNLTYEAVTNTNLAVYSRTSSDGVVWDEWTTGVSMGNIGSSYKYKINSTPRRFIQFKFEMSSGDGVYSGKISDYRLDFYQDMDEPTNHTSLTAYEQEGAGTTLSSGSWSNSVAPVFTWPKAETEGGASDTTNGSGVAGYYVYFGVGETADPQNLGVQTTAPVFYPANLVSGQSYFLRIKAYDNAGNVASDVGTTFVFRHDRTLPTAPQTVTVNPPGYTSSNSFDISWSGAEDADSGIGQYCYKMGQSGFEELCTSDMGITGLAAYKTGTNIFYVRSKDVAGNYSSSYSTVSYYYNSTAPPPPKNLRVEPPESSLNEFAFYWDPPESYYGSQAGLRYFYSINALPTANNVNQVGLLNTYLPKGPYATQPGENVFYVLTKDEAGNIDYGTYSSVSFWANTIAPGIPTDVEIGDISVKSTKSWRLALSWDSPVATGSGVANYRVYRSTTDKADCINNFDDFSMISTTSVASYVDTSLIQQNYYYCMKACDSTGNCSPASDTVMGYPDGRWLTAPSLVDEPVAVVKTKSAVVTWSTDRTSSSFVKYGKSSGNYGDEVGSSEQVALHEVALSGLDPGTTYYYKVLWTDEDGNMGSSDEYILTTNAAPFVSSVSIGDVSLFSAYVNFVLSNATKATIQYGLTVNYGFVEEISTSTATSSYAARLDGLEEGSEYHLRIVAEDEEGNAFYSDDYSFETLPVPKLSGVKIQQVRGMATATVRAVWNSNTEVTSIVTYYPQGRPENSKDQVTVAMAKKHQMIIGQLLDDTDYVFVIKGRDVMGNWAESTTVKIKTALDLRAPLMSNLQTETIVTGVGDLAKASIMVSWDTDELATSQVEYGRGTGVDYPSQTQEDGRLTSNHSVVIPDLSPAEVYHLRVVSKDGAANRSESYDMVVVTPKATKSALNLVIDNLSKSFGFFSNLSKINQ